MKLLVVFLLMVFPTICFGLKCHECKGQDMAECDKSSKPTDCPVIEKVNVVCMKAKITRTTKGPSGEQPEMTPHSFVRKCYDIGKYKLGCQDANEGDGSKGTVCMCDKDLCNSGQASGSGSGRPHLTPLTPWVVFVGFLSLAYLRSDV